METITQSSPQDARLSPFTPDFVKAQQAKLPPIPKINYLEVYLFVILLSFILNMVLFIFTGVIFFLSATALIVGFIASSAIKKHTLINGLISGIITSLTIVLTTYILIFLKVSYKEGLIAALVLTPLNLLLGLTGGFTAKKINWESTPLAVRDNISQKFNKRRKLLFAAFLATLLTLYFFIQMLTKAKTS